MHQDTCVAEPCDREVLVTYRSLAWTSEGCSNALGHGHVGHEAPVTPYLHFVLCWQFLLQHSASHSSNSPKSDTHTQCYIVHLCMLRIVPTFLDTMCMCVRVVVQNEQMSAQHATGARGKVPQAQETK